MTPTSFLTAISTQQHADDIKNALDSELAVRKKVGGDVTERLVEILERSKVRQWATMRPVAPQSPPLI